MAIQEQKHRKAKNTLKEKFAKLIAPGQLNELANVLSENKDVSNSE